MVQCQHFAYPGMGQILLKQHCYHQSIRIGDRIEVSGQGGWDTETGEVSKDVKTQIDQIFKNIDLALKDAGARAGPRCTASRPIIFPKPSMRILCTCAIISRNGFRAKNPSSPVWE
uniref:Uncharacterized protein n=1 Tax=Bionectria ochroleuca TaxID=29856 RepID=A0A8H7NBQ8_BIOOC